MIVMHKIVSSDDLQVTVALSEPVRRLLAEELTSIRRPGAAARVDAWTAVLRKHVSVEVVRFDGAPLSIYIPGAGSSLGTMSVIAPPKVKFETKLMSSGLIPHELCLSVDREFPLSSAHGNAWMRLAVHVADEVIISHPFVVCAKKPVSGTVEKVRRTPSVPSVSATREERLDAIQRALASCPPGSVVAKCIVNVADGLEPVSPAKRAPTARANKKRRAIGLPGEASTDVEDAPVIEAPQLHVAAKLEPAVVSCSQPAPSAEPSFSALPVPPSPQKPLYRSWSSSASPFHSPYSAIMGDMSCFPDFTPTLGGLTGTEGSLHNLDANMGFGFDSTSVEGLLFTSQATPRPTQDE